MERETKRQLLTSLSFVLFILFIGSMGYHWLEHFGWLDALYMTVITITTVGFREVQPLSSWGKIFTIFIIFAGIGTFFYLATQLIQYILESELYGSMRQRRLFRKVRELNEHFIVCGFGRVGSHVAEELSKAGATFVILDTSPEAISLAQAMGYIAIQGDATQEDTLRLVGVEKARGLIACLPSDSLNLYTILTARIINPNLYIVARIEHEEVEEKFLKIGVNRVVSLHSTAGRHMARLALNPFIENTMDITVGPQLKVTIEQIEVPSSSPFVQRTIAGIGRACDKATIIGVKKGTDVIWNPPPSTLVEENDILIVAGSTESLLKMMESPGTCIP